MLFASTLKFFELMSAMRSKYLLHIAQPGDAFLPRCVQLMHRTTYSIAELLRLISERTAFQGTRTRPTRPMLLLVMLGSILLDSLQLTQQVEALVLQHLGALALVCVDEHVRSGWSPLAPPPKIWPALFQSAGRNRTASTACPRLGPLSSLNALPSQRPSLSNSARWWHRWLNFGI
jgi:hypothetical protein